MHGGLPEIYSFKPTLCKELLRSIDTLGHQIVAVGITDILKCQEKADQINADLAILLDKIWDFLVNELNEKKGC